MNHFNTLNSLHHISMPFVYLARISYVDNDMFIPDVFIYVFNNAFIGELTEYALLIITKAIYFKKVSSLKEDILGFKMML